jgi:hypothetical protein
LEKSSGSSEVAPPRKDNLLGRFWGERRPHLIEEVARKLTQCKFGEER